MYGLKNTEGLMCWLKVSRKLENEDTKMAEELASHFQISRADVETLVRIPGNVISDKIDEALGRFGLLDILNTKIDHSQCPKGKCDKMNLCRIQWGSRNISRAVFGDSSFFGLNEINFSLPIPFEYTDNPDLFLTTQEARDLLAVDEVGRQNTVPTSLMNFSNVEFLLKNINDTAKIASRLQISEAKSGGISKWMKRVVKAITTIESKNFEIAYFRGKI